MSTPTPRTDDTPCQSTPPEKLRALLMDPGRAKSEIEWYASKTIERLEQRLSDAYSAKRYENQPDTCPACNWSNGEMLNYGEHGKPDWMCHGCATRQLANLRAEIAELKYLDDEASHGVITEDWRPIETAPKDGTHIFVGWTVEAGTFGCNPDGSIAPKATVAHWFVDAWYPSLCTIESDAITPTHWKPVIPPIGPVKGDA